MSGSTANGRADRNAPRDGPRPSRPKRFWRRVEWPLAGALTALAVVLGYVGFARYYDLLGQHGSPLDYLYLSLQLFPLQSGAVAPPIPRALEVARFLAPALTVFMAVAALLAVFSENIEGLRLRRFLSGHVVICGLGARGLELTEQFLRRGDTVVVVECDGDNSLLESCRERGAHVVVGDATDETVLRWAGVPAARHLVAVLPEDGANAEVAVRARRLERRDPARPLTAHVHVGDLELCELLKGHDDGDTPNASFHQRFFNVLETGARMMLDEVPQYGVAGEHGRHYVVVGLGKMGRSLVSQVAREWPLVRRHAGDRLLLTLIDAQAESKADLLRLRYPFLDGACQLDVRRIDKNAAEFERAAFLRRPDGRPVDAVFLCFDDDVHVVASALTLDRRDAGTPIVMRMTERSGLAALFDSDDARVMTENLRPVPLLEWTCDPDLLLGGEQETLARALFAGALWSAAGGRREDRTHGVTAAWQELTPGRRGDWRGLAARLDDLLDSVGCCTERCAGLIPAFSFSEREIEDLAPQEWPRGDGGDGDVDAVRRAAVRAIPAALARAGYAIRRRENDGTSAGESAAMSGEGCEHHG